MPAPSVNPSPIETIAPARHALALEPASAGSENFPSNYCTLYVGTGGDVSVYPTRNSQPVTYKNVPDGKALTVLCRGIVWDETTASDLIIEW